MNDKTLTEYENKLNNELVRNFKGFVESIPLSPDTKATSKIFWALVDISLMLKINATVIYEYNADNKLTNLSVLGS